MYLQQRHWSVLFFTSQRLWSYYFLKSSTCVLWTVCRIVASNYSIDPLSPECSKQSQPISSKVSFMYRMKPLFKYGRIYFGHFASMTASMSHLADKAAKCISIFAPIGHMNEGIILYDSLLFFPISKHLDWPNFELTTHKHCCLSLWANTYITWKKASIIVRRLPG